VGSPSPASRRHWHLAACLVALLPVGLGCATTRSNGDANAAAEHATPRERAETLCAHRHPGRQPPRPFATDACTWWPDGDWGACCVEHDIAYWCGGTAAERGAADRELRACIAHDHSALLAELTYLGVRGGGGAWLPTPWRWGYGRRWSDPPP
jgi:hypothetical protein